MNCIEPELNRTESSYRRTSQTKIDTSFKTDDDCMYLIWFAGVFKLTLTP